MKNFNKKSTLLLAVVLCMLSAKAQFLGIRGSNFGGVNNVNYNPAIADNRYKVDINFLALDVTTSNNYIGLKFDKLKFNDFDADLNLAEKLNGKKKFGYVSSTIQLPLSFLVSFGKDRKNNQAIAFSSHMNTVVNVDNLEEDLARNLRWGWGSKAFGIIGDFTNKNHTVNNMGIKGMAWADMGITYSRVVLDKEKHFLKVGATLKVVKGLAALYAYSDEFKYKFDNLDTISVQAKMKAGATKNLEYFLPGETFGVSSFFQKDIVGNNISKWSAAADIAVVYEFRKDKDKYKYNMDCKDLYYNERDKHLIQVGLSVINIGRLKFAKSDSVRDYDLNLVKSDENFNQNTLLYDWLNQGVKSADDNGTFKMWLPTTINLWADINIIKGLGVNVAAQINPIAQKKNNVHHLSIFSVTPRYDYKWAGIYMPVAIDQLVNVQWGLGMRLGPLYIASQDIFSTLIKTKKGNARDINIQLGLRVSIPNKKPKDKDKDGVSNKKDLCPGQKGTCESKGCPDRDGDGILDAEDKCPDSPGKIEFQGCPDRDEDGIIDMEDECPDQAGLKELKGCPDRDGDGIADKDDLCPDVKGIKEFNGCPDRDGDGVEDSKDKCPDVAGDKNHDGCPDSDGDGLYDNEDNCVTVVGPRENQGCPYADTDGDGVLDKDDACPTIVGPKENKGCPVVEEKVKKILLKARNIQFETGKAIIKPMSYEILNQVAKILKDYSYYNVSIDGHTDNTGNVAKNMILSQDRAKAAMDYLIKQGVDASRMTSQGFGITQPISDNKTTAGRAMNRRVEFNLIIK